MEEHDESKVNISVLDMINYSIYLILAEIPTVSSFSFSFTNDYSNLGFVLRRNY